MKCIVQTTLILCPGKQGLENSSNSDVKLCNLQAIFIVVFKIKLKYFFKF